jgi:Mn2+/Fe2+ NRAMP family transporter
MNIRSIWVRIKAHPLSRVGPGLVTGVADDDPSGIVTYSQAGAQFGFNMLWTMPVAYPLMAAIQYQEYFSSRGFILSGAIAAHC